jgi:hypothetical protein
MAKNEKESESIDLSLKKSNSKRRGKDEDGLLTGGQGQETITGNVSN